MKNEFPKAEKLCGQMRIKTLYDEGARFVSWPVRVTYQPTEGPTQVLVWAPKSLFKHAVDRNHLRRLMREAWRLNNQEIKNCKQHYQIAFNYIDRNSQPYALIEKGIRKSIKRILNESENNLT